MGDDRGRRLGSFLVGGLVGSAAALAAAGRMRVRPARRRRTGSAGLAAFEGAPCYAEAAEREARAAAAREGDDPARW